MPGSSRKKDPLPGPEASPEEIGEFWDTHSLADYWDETHEVEFQVKLKRSRHLIPVEHQLARKLPPAQPGKDCPPRRWRTCGYRPSYQRCRSPELGGRA
jgi:hypothetical protein